MKVVVIGSINMDLVAQVEKIPSPGETVIGADLRTFPGGKGANQAVAAARLGAEVVMVGRVGNDVFASQLKNNLKADNVDLTYVQNDAGSASGVALIVVDDTGQNSIVVASGANTRVSPADVEAAADTIIAADVVLLQLEIPLETVIRAAQLAHNSGVKVILNPAPAQKLPVELLVLVDILVPNEIETALLSGMAVSSHTELETAAARLLDSGVGTVILTLGKRGALLAQEDKMIHFPAFSVVRAVDSTAAGDAFVGALAVAIAKGVGTAQAVQWGNAAGALTVTRVGAQPSLPTLQEVNSLLDQATDQQH